MPIRSGMSSITGQIEPEHLELFALEYGKIAESVYTLASTNINSLPNDKILDWSKLKVFADDKINLAENFKFGLGRVENSVGKGENAGYQHFLLFPQCFQKPSVSGSLKVGIVW